MLPLPSGEICAKADSARSRRPEILLEVVYLRFLPEILPEQILPSLPVGITAFSALSGAFEPSVGMIRRGFHPIPDF